MYDLLVAVTIPVRAAGSYPTAEEVFWALGQRMEVWPTAMSDLEDAIEVIDCEEACD